MYFLKSNKIKSLTNNLKKNKNKNHAGESQRWRNHDCDYSLNYLGVIKSIELYNSLRFLLISNKFIMGNFVCV